MVDGDIWIWNNRTGLNLNCIKLPSLWSPWESSISTKNPHGRVGNRIWNLMISSQRLWPLDHEATFQTKVRYTKRNVHLHWVHRTKFQYLKNKRAFYFTQQRHTITCEITLYCSIFYSCAKFNSNSQVHKVTVASRISTNAKFSAVQFTLVGQLIL
jgi:hypothetical protein